MTVWDLSRIRYTVRKLTGKFDTDQLPDSSPGSGTVSVANPPGVDDYINDFYLYDFPEHLRVLKLRDYFQFTTLPNCGTYNVPQTIYQLEPPIYVDGYQSAWHQDPNSFYRIWPDLDFIDAAISTTDGTNISFTFTLTQTPIEQGSLVIGLQPNADGTPSPQLETFSDTDTPVLLDQPLQEQFTNPGTLTGNLGGTGTVDYLTGIVTITYNTIPVAGLNINAHYHPYVASRPRDILFFQQQLFLRPIPNDTYTVKMISYVQPTVALTSLSNSPTQTMFTGDNISGSAQMSTVPLWNEWWQLITLGAALKILTEEGDYDEIARLKPIFEEQKMLAQRRELKQLANQRIPSRYMTDTNNVANGNPIWPYY